MRKTLVVLGVVAVVAIPVWYVVTHFPRQTDVARPGESASGDSQPSALSPEAIPLPALVVGVCGVGCGVRRWSVKTLSDAYQALVNMVPQDATAEESWSGCHAPAFLPARGRAPPVELTVYRVEARLLHVFGQRDGDWHLVLQGLVDPGATLIAEIPDAACQGACTSGLGEAYAWARDAVAAWLQGPDTAATAWVRVTGAGPFDSERGQDAQELRAAPSAVSRVPPPYTVPDLRRYQIGADDHDLLGGPEREPVHIPPDETSGRAGHSRYRNRASRGERGCVERPYGLRAGLKKKDAGLHHIRSDEPRGSKAPR